MSNDRLVFITSMRESMVFELAANDGWRERSRNI